MKDIPESPMQSLPRRSYAAHFFDPTMQLKKKNILRESVRFEKHEPERRRGVGGYLLCAGGCCCCSCCLHALGGLIGAAATAARKTTAPKGAIVGCYWTSVAVLIGLVCLVSFLLSDGMDFASLLGAGAVIILLLLPLIQLAASITTYFWIHFRTAAFPDKKVSLSVLRRITLWSFLGALAGGILMIVSFKMFN